MSYTNSLHYDLCCKAATWIRQRKNCEPWKSQNLISAVEIICLGAEYPDVYANNGTNGTVIEVKTSHADFVADQKKPSRTDEKLALGDYRYYLCPEGIIKPEELPSKWGLLYYKNGRIYKVVQAQEAGGNKLWDMLILTSIMRREGLTGRTYNYRKAAVRQLLELENTEYDYGHNVCHHSEE